MPSSNYTVRIDDELRKDATELFEKMGLTLPAAINVFLRKSVSGQRMPFMLGDDDDARSAQTIPDGIEWPRWDDGTIFNPNEIGSRRAIDPEGNEVWAHRLCYDGGIWFILTDDDGRPIASTGGFSSDGFPRRLFEGWQTQEHSKPSAASRSEWDNGADRHMGFHISRETVENVIELVEGIFSKKTSWDDFEDYLNGLSDDQINALFAIYFLTAHMNPDFEAAIEEMRCSHYGPHKASAFAEKASPVMASRLKESLDKMTAEDWELLAK